MKYAKRLERLGTETAFDVLAKVIAKRERGEKVINFSIGEPDFNTPKPVKEAGMQAIYENYTHYTPAEGVLPLRKAVTQYIERTRNVSVDPSEVVVTPGGKPILFHTILACVEEGAEVLYPSPGFPIYESMIRFVGANPVPIAIREKNNFTLDPREVEKKITKNTQMLILNTPHNPTGGLLTYDQMREMAKIAKEHHLWILSDEIYSQLVYEDPFTSMLSFPEVRDQLILLDGFSKTYAMTGWRLGFGIFPKPLTVHIKRLIINAESCTASFIQQAGITALLGPQDEAEEMRATFHKRRDRMVEGLNQIDGFSCLTPKGAFYLFPNVTGACQKKGFPSAKALADALLEEANVAVLSASAFGCRDPEETQEYLRFSYAASWEDMAEGLGRLKTFMG